MAERQSSNPNYKKPKVTKEVESAVLQVSDIVYVPTDLERRCKAEFWVKWLDGPSRKTDTLTAAAVAQVLGKQTLNQSWSKPGFKDWFLNGDSFRISVEQYCMEAVEITRQIMYNSEKDSDKLKAARTFMELGKKFETSKKEIVVADAQIQKMDITELKDFIKQNRESLMGLLEESDED